MTYQQERIMKIRAQILVELKDRAQDLQDELALVKKEIKRLENLPNLLDNPLPFD